jgi:hypothetical protein
MSAWRALVIFHEHPEARGPGLIPPSDALDADLGKGKCRLTN